MVFAVDPQKLIPRNTNLYVHILVAIPDAQKFSSKRSVTVAAVLMVKRCPSLRLNEAYSALCFRLKHRPTQVTCCFPAKLCIYVGFCEADFTLNIEDFQLRDFFETLSFKSYSLFRSLSNSKSAILSIY